MDSTGSKESSWGGLFDKLKDTGMAVMEAAGDRLGNEIVDRLNGGGDALPAAQTSQQAVLPEYGQPVMATNTANPVGGFQIGGVRVDQNILLVSLLILGGALAFRAVKG